MWAENTAFFRLLLHEDCQWLGELEGCPQKENYVRNKTVIKTKVRNRMRVGREGGRGRKRGEREKEKKRKNWNELISLPLPAGTHVIKKHEVRGLTWSLYN